LADRRDRRALRALFSRFVSEPVVDQIMKERDLFMSGGRPRPQVLTATVLFADVAGFTTICEGLEPAPLIAWLDRYIDTNAARCALAMESAMDHLNDAWCAEGLPVGGLRVGVHTGPMVAGSLGQGARM